MVRPFDKLRTGKVTTGRSVRFRGFRALIKRTGLSLLRRSSLRLRRLKAPSLHAAWRLRTHKGNRLMGYVVAAYSIAALVLILYEVRLWGELRRGGKSKSKRSGQESGVSGASD